eukprot:754582-Hanusia_phi.AAC.1
MIIKLVAGRRGPGCGILPDITVTPGGLRPYRGARPESECPIGPAGSPGHHRGYPACLRRPLSRERPLPYGPQ